jgi:hypothetical protein
MICINQEWRLSCVKLQRTRDEQQVARQYALALAHHDPQTPQSYVLMLASCYWVQEEAVASRPEAALQHPCRSTR